MPSRRRALHPGPRRSQGDPRDFYHGLLDETMAKVCEMCGKGPRFGHRISHAHNLTKRRWNPNLQRVRAVVNGTVRKIRVCTQCLKSGKIEKPAIR